VPKVITAAAALRDNDPRTTNPSNADVFINFFAVLIVILSFSAASYRLYLDCENIFGQIEFSSQEFPHVFILMPFP
jgi:hypothetical protein